jgi:hypothetical protein
VDQIEMRRGPHTTVGSKGIIEGGPGEYA